MAWKKTPDELLRKNRYPRATQPCIDYDYIDKLSEEDKLWLALFTNMCYNNTNETSFFGMTEEEGKEYMKKIYKETNSRNSDLYQRVKGARLLDDLDIEK